MELQIPSSISHSSGISVTNHGCQRYKDDELQVKPDLYTNPENVNNGEPFNAHDALSCFEDVDSTCSTPYVSAPSSPGRESIGGFFYSAPASPMHFALTSVTVAQGENNTVPLGCEFEFSARSGSNSFGGSGSMSSADELFLNGKIRPVKLSTHLQCPQVLTPLPDLEVEEDDEAVVDSHVRGRDLRLRNKSLRRTRSLSPLRNNPFEWAENDDDSHGGMLSTEEDTANKCVTSEIEEGESETVKPDELGSETTPTSVSSSSSSRSSSAGRNSKRWVFLKDFLYRSKSEGRSNNRFWSNISFSPVKEKKPTNHNPASSCPKEKEQQTNQKGSDIGFSDTQNSKSNTQACSSKKPNSVKPVNGVGLRRVPPSPHELHYKANRAQAEELRKKTVLPYRQGLFGCLGFTSKGYGVMNGFARALNPVSSR